MTMIVALAAALRVFSADFCADQYVLALADKGDIAALSPDAEKDFSFMRKRAAGVPQHRAEAEAAIASGADIILRFWGGDARRFERLGLKVVTLDYASDFEGVAADVEKAAVALGEEERGRRIITGMNARLEALKEKGPSGKAALYVTPGGVTAGANTMIDAIFSAAGVSNAAAEAGLSYWPPISAETLVADPPAFIVAGFFSANSERVNHWSAARHPAIRQVLRETPHVFLDTDVLSCPGWYSVEAAEKIRASLNAKATK